MVRQYERKRILITVRTYPTPARQGIEVSCTAGITEHGEWIRLFPVPYRFLSEDKRFRKYQWIEASVTKASDHRRESYHVDVDSIEIVSERLPTTSKWKERRELLAPLLSDSLCSLQARRDRDKFPTLGFFKPKTITGFDMLPIDPKWSESELGKLRQVPLFQKVPARELVKIPFDFRYRFTCDEPRCNGHNLTCTDWELGASYLNWRRDYGEMNWKEKFLEQFESNMIHRNDTHFYVGTVHGFPGSWIIVGLFYPRL